MTWKQSIDDIKIICKKDGEEMVLESNWNGLSGIFVCPRCGEHLNLRVR